ncbi:Trafficking protein particle complex subunit 13, partial [Araneus ventricosus]
MSDSEIKSLCSRPFIAAFNTSTKLSIGILSSTCVSSSLSSLSDTEVWEFINTILHISASADLQIGLQKIVLTGQRGNYCSFTQLNPDESVDDVIHHEVKEIGTHILACTVNYTTMNNEKLHFRKFFKFQ